jgi:sodium-dependent phosphate cotransporter
MADAEPAADESLPAKGDESQGEQPTHQTTAELAPYSAPSGGSVDPAAPLPRDSGAFAPTTAVGGTGRWQVVTHLAMVFLLLYVFLVGVECLSSGIKGLGKGTMDEHLVGDLNPMLGLLAGILATTLVQSSSVTTALIVSLVASGEVSVSAAVPMIMGANIGTTVTNTIASMAHATRSSEFRRAFAAATCHDFFNFLAVVTLLPLELVTRGIFGVGLLEGASGWIAELTVGAGGAKYKSPIKASFKAGRGFVEGVLGAGFEGKALKIALALAGVAIIFVALTGIVKVMRRLVMSKLERYVNRFLGQGGPMGILVGIVITVMVQSSSITTSILVPLAGAGLMTVYQVYPITLGANLGTTITALLACLAVSGDQAAAARQIALVHLGFNLAGMLIWYAPPPVRGLAPRLARRLAAFAARRKRWAVAYVAFVFYGVPAGIFFLSKAVGLA